MELRDKKYKKRVKKLRKGRRDIVDKIGVGGGGIQNGTQEREEEKLKVKEENEKKRDKRGNMEIKRRNKWLEIIESINNKR